MTLESRLDALLETATGGGRIVGAVVLVARDGAPAYARAIGFADREAGIRMKTDQIFRLASVSKPIVSAAALALCELGVLSLDAPITNWLPDFRPKLADGTEPTITLRHLLSHTSGLCYTELGPDDPYRLAGISSGLDLPGRTMEDNLARIATVPLPFAPGTAWRYGTGIDVAGAVIAAATRRPLSAAVATYVTGPLGMTDTGFAPPDRTRLATPYGEGVPPNRMPDPYEVTGELGRGTVLSPGRCFDPRSFQSGGAGMNGTAGDVLKLIEAFRRGGDPILGPPIMAEATRNQIGALPREPKDAGWRFGLLSGILDDRAAANVPMARGTLEWGGIYGHSWMVDRRSGISIVACTNTAVEGCLGAFPKDVRRAVYG